jgi:signal transduction histidine kinase
MAQSTRVEIAREIHDGIAQDLVALGYQLDSVLAQPNSPAVIRHEIRTVRFRVTELLDKVRSEIFNLRSPIDFASELTALARDISPEIVLQIDHIEVDSQRAELLLPVIGELVRNAHHHSGASQICLELSGDHDGLMVTISDNGNGGAEIAPGRYGIIGVIERIEELSGSIDFKSGEEGTTVTIRV